MLGLNLSLNSLAGARVDAVGGDHEIGAAGGRLRRIGLGAVFDVDAERMRAAAENFQQHGARGAAEAVAADAVRGAAEVDLDVVPIGEVADDLAIGFAVVGLEGLKRLVGEHHAEAERVVGLVALEHGDARLRPRLFHQDGEVEAGRAAADDVNVHARLRSNEGYLKLRKFKLKVFAAQEANMASLQGRHALVTGGGRGIGRAIAAALTEAGAAVTIAGRNEKALADVVGQGEAAGYVIADVTDAKAVDSGIKQAVAARGPVDLLIANAGTATALPFAKTTPDQFRNMFELHVLGMLHPVQAVLGGMIERGFGRIVAVASIVGLKGYRQRVALHAPPSTPWSGWCVRWRWRRRARASPSMRCARAMSTPI